MANLDTTAEILKKVLMKCGELQDGTSKYQEVALEYINEIYQKIVGGASEYNLDVGEPWIWARGQSPLVLTLLPGIQTGTVSVALGQTTGTFSTTPKNYLAQNQSVAGWWINVNNGSEWYRVVTHVAGTTAFTLDGTFNDPTGTAYSFICVQIDYALTAPEVGGIARLAGSAIVQRNQTIDGDQEGKVYGSDYNEMRKIWPIHVIERGVPTRFATTSYADGAISVRFNKYIDPSDSPLRLEFDYVPVPADLTSEPDTTPILPRRFRNALVYGPAAELAGDKNDDRAEGYAGRFSKILAAMKRDEQTVLDKTSKRRGWLVPRAEQLTAAKSRKIYNL